MLGGDVGSLTCGSPHRLFIQPALWGDGALLDDLTSNSTQALTLTAFCSVFMFGSGCSVIEGKSKCNWTKLDIDPQIPECCRRAVTVTVQGPPSGA